MTGRPRRKAPSVSGFFVISSKLFTAKPPLRIDRGFAAAFEVFLYALLCKNWVVCFPLVAVKPARFAALQLPVDGSRCHAQPVGNVRHPVAVQETYGSKYAGGIFGICMLGYMIICTFISPKISSALVKATGSYTASMIYAIIACIIAVIFYTTIPQPKRRTLAEVAAEEKAAQEKAAQA